MMIFTHIMVGVLVGAVVSLFSSNPVVLVAAGAIGGSVPDLDMLWTHRKTLHFPVGFSLASVLLGLVYVLSNSASVLVLATGVVAAALHSLMDILGGGKEMRPWEETDDRAAFNHVTGEWIAARRIFYDGSVPDLAIATVSGVAVVRILPSAFTSPIVLVVGLAVVYTLLRRYITERIPAEYATFSSYIQAKLKGIR
jgi:hypothetical protein